MLHSIQCYEIICNYYTMFQTLYYTYGQGSLLLGVRQIRGIGHSRQGCDKSTIDYPQPCVHLAVTTCVIPMPDSVSCIQSSDPFCFSEYMRGYQNRFLLLANIDGGGFSFGFLSMANICGGNPRPERVFVYAPWGVIYPITYYANRFISGQYKDVVKVKFEDKLITIYSIGVSLGILYLVLLQNCNRTITKLLHKIKLSTHYPHVIHIVIHISTFATRPKACALFISTTIKHPFNRFSCSLTACPADSFGLICCPFCLFFVLRFLFSFSARVRSFLIFSANGTQDGRKRAFPCSVYNFPADGQTDGNGAILERLTDRRTG